VRASPPDYIGVHVEGQLVSVRVPNGAQAIPEILSTFDVRRSTFANMVALPLMFL
jgi:hypothetical protein